MKTHTCIPQAAPKIVVRSLSAHSPRGVLTYGSLTLSVRPRAVAGGGPASARATAQRRIGIFALRRGILSAGPAVAAAHTTAGIAASGRPTAGATPPQDRNYNRPVQPSLSGQRRAHVAPGRALRRRRGDGLQRPAPRSADAAAPCSCTSPAPGLKPTEGCIALARPHLLRLLQAVSRRHRRRSRQPDAGEFAQKKRPEMPKHRAEFGARLGEGARSGDIRGPRTG